MTLIKHPSERGPALNAIWTPGSEERRLVPGRAGDRKLADKPERTCANCGRSFQPTLRRRLLCASCFGRAGDTSPFEP